MKVWKRNAVVAAIVLFVCVAVYLNWSYGQKDALASGAAGSNDTKTLGEAELVGGDGAVDVTSDPAQADAPAEIIETNYFDAARLSRQEARDEALSILQSTVDDPNADA